MKYELSEEQTNIFYPSETTIDFLLGLHVWWKASVSMFRGLSPLGVYVSDRISWAPVWEWPQKATASSPFKWLCLWGSYDLAPLGADKRYGRVIRVTPPGQRQEAGGVWRPAVDVEVTCSVDRLFGCLCSSGHQSFDQDQQIYCFPLSLSVNSHYLTGSSGISRM